MDTLYPEELGIINRIYGMAFSEEGVKELLSKWSSDRVSALSEMSESTGRILMICSRIKSILDRRERPTPLYIDCSLALGNFLDQYKQDHFPKAKGNSE